MRKRYFYFLLLFACALQGLDAQCLMDRHNTNVNDGWISCELSPNPNGILGDTHWIMYEFPSSQNLYKTQVWNVNQDKFLLWGAKLIQVDISTDGLSWLNQGQYSIQRGTGKSTYQGTIGPDLQGVSAQYLLLTILENYGGECAGFGEWKFYTQEDNTTELTLDLDLCESDDVIKHINGGMNLGGLYSGTGVLNNYDDSFDFDPVLAGPGDHVITYSYTNNGQSLSSTAVVTVQKCTEAGCPPCIECEENAPAVYNANPVVSDIYYDEEIISSGSIASGTDVSFRGTNYVELQEAFNSITGADFVAQIRDCETDLNLLQNGSFDQNTNNWELNQYSGASGTLTRTEDTYFVGVGSGQVELLSGDGTNWHIQLEQDGLSVEAGETYTLSFYGKATQSFNSWVSMQLDVDPWTSIDGSNVQFQSDWDRYTIEFECGLTSNQVNILFNLAAEIPNTVWFDNVTLTKNN